MTIGRRRQLAIGALVVLSTFFSACGGAVPKGTFEFGDGWTECGVTNKATTFTPSETVYYTGHLTHEIRADETVVWAVTYPDGTTDTNEEVIGAVGLCVRASIPPGCSPGHYVQELLWRSEVLARGEWDCSL